jgi:hypothetical protein
MKDVMARTSDQMGFFDRIGLAGWLLMLCGVTIVGLTIWIPAYLDAEDIRQQNEALTQQLILLEEQQQSHDEFQNAIANNDAQMLRRLGWEYLNLKPAAAATAFTDQTRANSWENPLSSQEVSPDLPRPLPRGAMADSMLIRYSTGDARPWVMGFGFWLIFMGLMSNPGSRQSDEA